MFILYFRLRRIDKRVSQSVLFYHADNVAKKRSRMGQSIILVRVKPGPDYFIIGIAAWHFISLAGVSATHWIDSARLSRSEVVQ